MSAVDEFNAPIAVNGGISRPDPWNFGDLVAQVAATATITLGGTETDGDALHFTFSSSQLPNGSYELTHTTSGAETLPAMATAIASLITNDPLLSSLGISAAAVGDVITVTWAKGPLGNIATIAFTKSAGATETAAITAFTGGAGYVIPQSDATIALNGSVIKLEYGKPIEVDYALLNAIVDAGVTVK